MKVAVKLGYVGQGYYGYQRQPGRLTVEGCVIQALKECGLVPDPEKSEFASAARTDRGVSALGQVIAFRLAGPAKAIVKRLNSKLPPDIFAWASAEVDEGFNPRTHARSKTYLYLFDNPGVGASALESISKMFLGEHDFAQFCRPSERATLRSIDEIRVQDGRPIRVYFRAKGFLWTQVRKIISAMELVATGDLEEGEVRDALAGRARLALAPAQPENLILWEIEYVDAPFRVEVDSLLRAKEFLEQSARTLELGIALRRTLLEGTAKGAPVA